MASQFYNVTTNNGDAKIANAIATATKLNITHVVFGDGNGSVPTPDKSRTALVNQVYSVAPSNYYLHPNIANRLIVEAIIPSDVGGFYIREVGLIADTTVLISDGSVAPIFKEASTDGTREYKLKFAINIVDSSIANITLDSSLIYVTQDAIVNNLTTDDATKPVSAKQAKLLNETKLSKSSNLSDLQNPVSARSNLGLGNAATRDVTSYTEDRTSGRLLRVGDFGVGGTGEYKTSSNEGTMQGSGFYCGYNSPIAWQYSSFIHSHYPESGYAWQLGMRPYGTNPDLFFRHKENGIWSSMYRVRTAKNTTVDGNGFVKSASPIIELYANKIELNEEAKQQKIIFQKLGIGDYLIKGSTGLANDGWYIEQPKDANGNIYHAVVHEQLESGDISIKTYEFKLNEIGQTVADLEKPIDIKENRFITLRLNELPQDTTAPQNPNVVDSVGNPAPSKYHYLEKGEWKITAENEVILENECYAAYQASLRPLTRRQFKLTLLENGLLDQIENSISAIEDDQMRARIQIEYAESTEFQRTSGSVSYMCQLLGLTDEQVDQMWEQALTL